ncbi:DUF2235 domain-containing protein [Saccharothrix syringae]|uniref:DUF2235 domain-containing protein n=1 Tax=Saccharothrix syringae TaxID=103733 RepID=UPI00068D6C67|nr:DUF2235 domain-containing protein [Saccharothrix syringae]
MSAPPADDRPAGRALVLCLDGTRNEPETGTTNVARVFDLAVKDERQLVYYDPGVGTMGSRAAATRFGKALTRFAGLVVGFGIKDKVEDAYRFLVHHYRRGDRIYVFGFSRGAYTARALVGMIRTVGLLRPGADNLVPYALKLYTRGGNRKRTEEQERAFWDLCTRFEARFGNPDFPPRLGRQVEFLGVWDTVKSVGWLNWRARYEQAHWPFTRKLPNVGRGRHALALDERRRHYEDYRFDPAQVGRGGGRLREMWFPGVHSDVGGTPPDDHRLADIALKWIVDEAVAVGLRVDGNAYREHVSVLPGQDLPADHALGRIHPNKAAWALLGLGWHRRTAGDGDEVHPSVHDRVDATRDDPRPYRPPVPLGQAATSR